MEGIKGVVFNRGKTNCGKYHKYLVCVMVISEEPIERTGERGETIVCGANQLDNPITSAIQCTPHYQAPYALGNINNAILQVANMDINKDWKIE